jgi:AcrR family transcriptional regulator
MGYVKSRRYAGLEGAERVAARRAALLDAGLELLGGGGLQATSVRAVCARAGLSARYFYESFKDLDELTVAVFDGIAAEAASTVLAAVAAAPRGDARATAGAAIGAFVSMITEDPRKARVLFAEARGSEVLERRRLETVHSFAALVAQQGRDFYGISSEAVADRIADVAAFMLVGGLTETFLAWLDGTLKATAEQLIDDCADLFVATGEGAIALARTRAARL